MEPSHVIDVAIVLSWFCLCFICKDMLSWGKMPIFVPVMKHHSFIWAFLGALAFLLVFSWSTSPLYLTYGADSPFFQTIGLGIVQGKVPYVDLFDHKGPVPFFMDALGYSLGMGRTGLFMVQLVSFTITLLLFLKIAGLFTDSHKKSLQAVALSMIPLADFITEGNQVEEWQLPYIALALYLVCKYILSGSGKHPAWQGLVYGLCFGMVFYNRPNDGVMWVGSLMAGLSLMWIVGKEYRRLFVNLAAFIGGFVIVTIPILAYFHYHDAIYDLFYGMILHNIQYAGDALFTWSGIGMILIPIVVVCTFLYLTPGNAPFRYVLVPMLVFTVILIGKRDYYHYLVPITPFMVMLFAKCLMRRWKTYLWIICSLFAVFSFREVTYIVRAASLRSTLQIFYTQSDKLFDVVPEEERNTIWNYNLVTYEHDKYPHLVSLMGCFLHRGLTPSSPILAAYDLFYMESTHGIRARNPKWVILNPEDSYNKDFDWIEANYTFVAESPAEPVCPLRLYKRKQ